jgi:hypothetical protein
MADIAPFDKCLQLLAEAADIASRVAGEFSNGEEFAELLRDALSVGRKDCWPWTDEERSAMAKDRAADWRFESNREEA